MKMGNDIGYYEMNYKNRVMQIYVTMVMYFIQLNYLHCMNDNLFILSFPLMLFTDK